MKYITIIFCIFIFGCGHGFIADKPFDRWTKEDTQRQLVYTAVHVVDWAQTVQISRDPVNYQEEGLLRAMAGNHPSESEVHQFFATTLLLQTAIPAMLKPKYRKMWQYTWIGAEASNDIRNFSLGLHGEF